MAQPLGFPQSASHDPSCMASCRAARNSGTARNVDSGMACIAGAIREYPGTPAYVKIACGAVPHLGIEKADRLFRGVVVPAPRFLERALESAEGDGAARWRLFLFELLRAHRKLHHMRAIVGLVREVHRRFVVVCGADEPYVRWNVQFASPVEQGRRRRHRVRHDLQVLILRAKLQCGKEVGEVLLRMRQVHLVQQDDLDGVPPPPGLLGHSWRR